MIKQKVEYIKNRRLVFIINHYLEDCILIKQEKEKVFLIYN